MMCAVLKHFHPMLGVDLHDTIPPPGPAVVPNIPHYVVAAMQLGPWGAVTGKSRTDVLTASYGKTMIRGTDIGFLIPHISSPHYLLPVIIIGSASKSEFGASSVITADGPVAVAILLFVGVNLNCCGKSCPPLPLGRVLAFTTHMTGFTLGDFFAGLITMVVDGAVQYGLNQIFGPSSPEAGTAWSLMTPYIGYTLSNLAEPMALIGLLGVGSPLGWSPEHSVVGGYGGNLTNDFHDWMMEKFNSPSVEQHPSGSPAASPAPTASPAPSPSVPPAMPPLPT